MRWVPGTTWLALLLLTGCAGEGGPKMSVVAADVASLPEMAAADGGAVEAVAGPHDLQGQELLMEDLLSDLPDVVVHDLTPPDEILWPDVVVPDVVVPDVQPQFAPGHWECHPWGESTQCVPMYETKWCGNGQCEVEEGESLGSCPADCDTGGLATIKCQAPVDCIFLPWPFLENGYWQCEWVGWGQGYECIPVPDGQFCGTPKGNWCAEEWGESPAACPADCAPGKLGPCESHLDCVHRDWPLKQ